MKQFSMHQTLSLSFSSQQEKLVARIQEIVQPDVIYVLGASLYSRCSEGIFCTHTSSSQQVAGYYLLVLLEDTHKRSLPQWQDQLEQYCGAVVPVTVIVLETATFHQWLTNGHRFARRVVQQAFPVFRAQHFSPPAIGNYDTDAEQKALEKLHREGVDKAREFLAGAELFSIRKQYKMAAFMLHQSAEQALLTILKMGTGFYCPTHSIDRLLRYAGMVSDQLTDVFTRKTDHEKRLFSLLQKAYIDTRYGENYCIDLASLLLLREWVEEVVRILEEWKDIL